MTYELLGVGQVPAVATTLYTAGNATALDMTGKTLSSVLKCRLYRDNTIANNLADKVAMLYVDFHYEVDAIGSAQEYIK